MFTGRASGDGSANAVVVRATGPGLPVGLEVAHSVVFAPAVVMGAGCDDLHLRCRALRMRLALAIVLWARGLDLPFVRRAHGVILAPAVLGCSGCGVLPLGGGAFPVRCAYAVGIRCRGARLVLWLAHWCAALQAKAPFSFCHSVVPLQISHVPLPTFLANRPAWHLAHAIAGPTGL